MKCIPQLPTPSPRAGACRHVYLGCGELRWAATPPAPLHRKWEVTRCIHEREQSTPIQPPTRPLARPPTRPRTHLPTHLSMQAGVDFNRRRTELNRDKWKSQKVEQFSASQLFDFSRLSEVVLKVRVSGLYKTFNVTGFIGSPKDLIKQAKKENTFARKMYQHTFWLCP